MLSTIHTALRRTKLLGIILASVAALAVGPGASVASAMPTYRPCDCPSASADKATKGSTTSGPTAPRPYLGPTQQQALLG